MPPAFFFRGHRGYGEKEHRIEDGQYEGQRKKRSEDVAGDIAFGVRPQKEADDSEHSQQHAVPERRRGEKEPCRGRRLPGGGSLHTRLAVGRGGFRKMFVRNVCKPDYDKKQEHDDEECGNEFRRVSASDTIGDHPFGGTYAKPPAGSGRISTSEEWDLYRVGMAFYPCAAPWCGLFVTRHYPASVRKKLDPAVRPEGCLLGHVGTDWLEPVHIPFALAAGGWVELFAQGQGRGPCSRRPCPFIFPPPS